MNHNKAAPTCWCGNTATDVFSNDYLKCAACGTLVVAQMPQIEMPDEREQGLYGREYWFSHQEQDYGHGNIAKRARDDLSERCLYWLNVLLKYRLPPAKILELGCAHGGFVALLKLMGFDSSGLEVSPAIVEYAKNSFGIEVLCGPIEKQTIERGSLDVIIMMDVLEHLQDPLETLKHCLSALKKDGILIIQTPKYEEGKSYDDLTTKNEPFLKLLQPDEHLYLFSQRSVKDLLKRAGFIYTEFEPAFFSFYDMFLIASREPLNANTQDNIEKALSSNSQTRFIQALLDMFEKNNQFTQHLREIEADRAIRLRNINELTALLKESEQDRAARLEIINKLSKTLEKRAVNKKGAIDRLNKLVQELEMDRARRLSDVNKLTALLKESENDRAAKLKIINEFKQKLEQKIIVQKNKQSHATTIAIDLTLVLPCGENGGAKILTIELIRNLAKIAPDVNFILLTADRNHEELSILDSHNVRRVCVINFSGGVGNDKETVKKEISKKISLFKRMQTYAQSFSRLPIYSIKKILPRPIKQKLKAILHYNALPKIQPEVVQEKVSLGLLEGLGVDLLFCPLTAPFYHEKNIPTVSVVLDLQYKYYPQFFSQTELHHRNDFFEKACEYSDYLICISDFVNKTVLENSSKNPEGVKTIYINLANRLPTISNDQRLDVLKRFGLTENEFLLYPANFWKHKNHETLFIAFNAFREKSPESKIKLVCTGALKERMAYLGEVSTKMGLEDFVVMPGYLTNEEFTALLSSCRAVIFPSLYEGFGMPVIEAMRNGKPVLCSNVTSLPEIAGNAALFFDPHKPEEICQAIEIAENQPERMQSLVELGFQQSKKFSDPVIMAQKYLEVFNAALISKNADYVQ